MMTDSLPYYLNRALDVSPVANFITQIFTIYVVVVHTSKQMRHFANLILMGILWNFMGNLLYAFAHLIPMFPAECIRIDGILSASLKSDFLGHLFIKLVVLTVVNTALAILFSFQFRYMSVVHSVRIAKFHPAWGYLYCALVYLAVCAIFIVLYEKWTIPLSDYPDPIERPTDERLFCFKPHGVAKNTVIACLFSIIIAMLFGIAVFSALSFHQLNKKNPGMHANTFAMQKRLLRNLLYLTAVPVFIGGIPLVTLFTTLYFNEITQARVICSVCTVILLNYGVIYNVTTLMVFKNYRNTTKKLLMNAVREIVGLKKRMGNKSVVSVVSVTQVRLASRTSSHKFSPMA